MTSIDELEADESGPLAMPDSVEALRAFVAESGDRTFRVHQGPVAGDTAVAEALESHDWQTFGRR